MKSDFAYPAVRQYNLVKKKGGDKMKVQGSIEIAAAPGKVWPVLTERENILQWAPRCERWDFVGEQRRGVGGMFYMVEKTGGRLLRYLCEVTEWEENKKLVFRLVLGDVKRLDGAFTIEATEAGSRFTSVYNVVLPWWIIGNIMGLFMRKQMKKEAEGDLANVKRLAEA
jgi:uncharacterized protein YndB with AHSA1/START domain